MSIIVPSLCHSPPQMESLVNAKHEEKLYKIKNFVMGLLWDMNLKEEVNLENKSQNVVLCPFTV